MQLDATLRSLSTGQSPVILAEKRALGNAARWQERSPENPEKKNRLKRSIDLLWKEPENFLGKIASDIHRKEGPLKPLMTPKAAGKAFES